MNAASATTHRCAIDDPQGRGIAAALRNLRHTSCRSGHCRLVLCALSVVALPLLAACGGLRPPPPPQPNLRWDGPKVYFPPSVAVQVSGFGINGPIDVLPPMPPPYPVTIARDILNDGTAAAAAGYQISETVQRLNLISTGSSIGFVAAPVPPITSQTVLGPALAAAAGSPVIFTFPVPACGIYMETLVVDGAGAVAESNEADNSAVHYFAVPGSMMVNIAAAPPGPVRMWHAPGPPGGLAGPPPGGGPLVTHTFTITATSPATTFHYNYRQAPYMGSQGSVGVLVGPAPVMPPAPPVAGPIVIAFQVTPRSHNDAPMTDILTETVQEDFVPKVTAITSDACFVTQTAAKVKILHPGR